MSEHETQSDGGNQPGVEGEVKKLQDSQKFLWNTSSQCDEQKRIFIKEEALKEGIEKCEKLINIIKYAFEEIESYDLGFAKSIWSPESRKEWISKCDAIFKDYRDFSVLVGVAGRTGSGKTSALNALLGYQELLPTNNEEASTAVPCRIEYNNNDDPTRAFRCQVAFRTKGGLRKQLDNFVENIRCRDELKALPQPSHEDDLEIRNYVASLKPTFEMIETVFGIKRCDAEVMSTDDILNSRPEALKLLGATKELYDGELEGISEKIKPYMDSTEANHGNSEQEFAAWPLIEHVKLFVKSDVLKNGIVLVDLPGVADDVESRAQVAERYFNRLTATLLVLEAKRAATDQTNVSLMSKHQEMTLMLDGNFHKRSFCVCLSQIDTIDRWVALKKKDAKSNNVLQSWITQEGTLKEKKAEKEQEKSEADRKLGDHKRELSKAKKKTSKANKKLNTMEVYDGSVSICPISAKAFWDCRKREEPMPGFPQEVYTGIPNFSKWIRTATIPKREAHVDGLLNRLLTQYNIVCLWSRDERGCNRLDISRERFEKDVLAGVFANMGESLDRCWVQLNKEVIKRDPLNHRKKCFKECASQCDQVVRDWSFKNSGSEDVPDKIHWRTYRAMIKGKGARFVSRADSIKREHNWMQDVSHVFFNAIVEKWNQSLNYDVPALAESTYPAIDKIWDDFLQRLEMGVTAFEVEILKDLRNEVTALESIKNSVKHRLLHVLKDVSRDARKMHPELVRAIQKQWEPTFNAALNHTGVGCHVRREKLLLSFARSHGEEVFNTAFVKMRGQLNKAFAELPRKLTDVSSSAVREVQNHISVLLDKIIKPSITNEVKLEKVDELKVRMQQDIRAVLLEWELEWKVPSANHSFVTDMGDSNIPEEYRSVKVSPEASYDVADVDMELDDI
ncbi:hypothetical protein EKO27_g11099 [Xylaria grammica]|uniref:Dynamin N-terminal domain-containing protein n=1 Tax=Xylaria grammica TaxID=363999 RepID=A0A439CPE5_9PEZI|nr:hypothetical protein EKO27_g11099 [Xylaria grammica]